MDTRLCTKERTEMETENDNFLIFKYGFDYYDVSKYPNGNISEMENDNG